MKDFTSKHSKYYTGNPISKKLVTNFLVSISELYKDLDVTSVFDGGCGEGFILHTLNQVKEIKEGFAIDIDINEVEDATRNLPFCKVKQGSLYEIPFESDQFDLVICSEVLEHLENPEKGLAELHRISRKYTILSVPREPVWRIMNMARFKYWHRLGNTPGHLNHWNKSSFMRFVNPYFKIVKVLTPLPWTMILAKKK